MKTRLSLLATIALTVLLSQLPGPSLAQEVTTGEIRDGIYEITLKTRTSKKIRLDEIVRDRDLDPKALFRVTTGGYLSFREKDWIDKIEFKVFDIPVSSMPEYGKFSKLLVSINERIWRIKQILSSYDKLALRLMDICGRSKFPSFRAMDQNIALQLSVYRRLVLLKSLVTNSLARFVKDRTCVDRFERYQNDLEAETRRLTKLCRDYEKLKKEALEAAYRTRSTGKKEGALVNPSSPRSASR